MINVRMPEDTHDLRPRITVIGVGGAGGNAVNNMIRSQLEGRGRGRQESSPECALRIRNIENVTADLVAPPK